MMTDTAFSPVRSLASYRRKALVCAIADVLNPVQRTMVGELIQAEDPHHAEAEPEDVIYWMRLNMPVAARQVEDILHPFPLAD
jgi:hypothetical protein